ncbi:MAG: SDR family NAD(P)-dependent oxidoreductase [Arenicellales bacterium WSBS_2016_MAG_OTU3]
MKIENTVAMVTGAASGMGAATALHLANLGAKVALLDLNLEAVQNVAERCGGTAYACDVASADAAVTIMDAIVDELGAPRVLVNCAGIATAERTVGKSGPMPLDSFKRVIDVNLIGSFNMMRLAAAKMFALEREADERGVIINTASVAGYEGQIGQAAYAASKGGIIALTIQSAREFASQGVRVMTIAPGLIATPMLLGFNQEIQDSLAASVPFPKRFGQPEEYARLAQHIIENQMLNGEVIRLDGAIRLAPR